MAKQPEFTKYLPLDDWFRDQPASARRALTWLNHGWAVESFDLKAEKVKFVRG